MASGRPLQLIRCGDDTDNYAFTLNEAHLDEVGSPPPPEAPPPHADPPRR